MAIVPNKNRRHARIYCTPQALQTVLSLSGLNEVDRDCLNANSATQLNRSEGYYLCAESMHLEVLPEDAEVMRVLSPTDMATYCKHVQFPPELRGVVFSGAPKLPTRYATVLSYWSPLTVTAQHVGAETCQNLLNEYEVDVDSDVLLSNGVVVFIQGVSDLTAELAPHQYMEIQIPVDAYMLGMEREKFDSAEPYAISAHLPVERIYLKMSDIEASPDPDFIAIAILHSENHDAEFYQ